MYRTDIGQLIATKYKVIPINGVPNNRIGAKNEGKLSIVDPSNLLMKKIAPITEIIKITNKSLGSLFDKSSPSRFKNLPSIYSTLWNLLISKGKIRYVIGILYPPRFRTELMKGSAARKAIIPESITRLNFLSLVQNLRLFASSKKVDIGGNVISVCRLILSHLKQLCKPKAMAIALTSILTIFCSSNAQADEKNQNLISIIAQVEKEYSIPKGLLASIAHVESGTKPFAVNIAGKATISDDKQKAAEIVQTYLIKGHTNIDVGVMQINWRWHGESFVSVEEMLDPEVNIGYAAKLLTNLFEQHGTWYKAVKHYHSANPNHNIKYSRKILVTWLDY